MDLLAGLSVLQKVREYTTCLKLLRTVVHGRMPSTKIVVRGTTVADHTHRLCRSQRMRPLPPRCRGRQIGRRQDWVQERVQLRSSPRPPVRPPVRPQVRPPAHLSPAPSAACHWYPSGTWSTWRRGLSPLRSPPRRATGYG